jgi:hypothetical protein
MGTIVREIMEKINKKQGYKSNISRERHYIKWERLKIKILNNLRKNYLN